MAAVVKATVLLAITDWLCGWSVSTGGAVELVMVSRAGALVMLPKALVMTTK